MARLQIIPSTVKGQRYRVPSNFVSVAGPELRREGACLTTTVAHPRTYLSPLPKAQSP